MDRPDVSLFEGTDFPISTIKGGHDSRDRRLNVLSEARRVSFGHLSINQMVTSVLNLADQSVYAVATVPRAPQNKYYYWE